MRKLLYILLLLTFDFLLSTAYAQVDTEFWFAIPHLTNSHDQSIAPGQGRVYFTAFADTAHVTISQPATRVGEAYYLSPKQIVVPPDSSVCVYVGGTGGLNRVSAAGGNSYCGVHVESDVLITSYYAQTNNNSEIYTLKGKNAEGKAFVVPSQRAHGNAYGGVASIEVLATQDTTTVQVLYPGETTPQTIVLWRGGETYTLAKPVGVAWIGGTYITSDKPIVVNTTDDSVQAGGQDLIGEQLVPTSLLGTEYIAVKHNTLNDEKLYLYPLPGKTLNYTVNGGATETIAAGGYGVVTLSEDVTLVTGDGPYVCFQMTGDGTELGGTVLPRLECTGSREVALHRQFQNQRVVLMVEAGYTNHFRVNGQPLNANFAPVLGTNWAYAVVSTGLFNARGVSRIVNDSAVFHCSVLDYGGGTCSYGYFSAYGQVALHPVSEREVYIYGDALQVSLQDSMLFEQIQWILPDGTTEAGASLHLPAQQSGYYRVTGVSREGCLLDTDTAEVLVHVVQPLGRDTTVCQSIAFPHDSIVLYDSLHLGANMWRDTMLYEAKTPAVKRQNVSLRKGTTYNYGVNVRSVGQGTLTCNLYIGSLRAYSQSNIRATTASKRIAFRYKATVTTQTEARIEVISTNSSARIQVSSPFLAPMVTVRDTMRITVIDCTPEDTVPVIPPAPNPCPETQYNTWIIEQYCDTLLPYEWRDRLYYEPGTYYDTIPTQVAYDEGICDSIIYVLTLDTVHCLAPEPPIVEPDPNPCPELMRDTMRVLAYCDTLPAYEWHGMSFGATGYYSDTVLTKLTYDEGVCDSLIHVLYLEVIHCEPDPEPEPDPDPEPEPQCVELIAQRWDDVLFVVNATYNGGYDFTAYAWYRNGLPIDSRGSYMYAALTPGDTYEVEVVTTAGETMRSCPYTVVPYGEDPAQPRVRKVMEQGRLIIIRDEQRYTPLGQLAE